MGETATISGAIKQGKEKNSNSNSNKDKDKDKGQDKDKDNNSENNNFNSFNSFKPFNRKRNALEDVDEGFSKILNDTFGLEDGEVPSNAHEEEYLSYLYPLVDIKVEGPVRELLKTKVGMYSYTITLSRVDGKSMRCMKRENYEDPLVEHHKAIVVLIFDSEEKANFWKTALEKGSISQRHDTWHGYQGFVEEKQKKNINRSDEHPQVLIDECNANSIGKSSSNGFQFNWQKHSVLGKLVLPTSGLGYDAIERLKDEIGMTISTSRTKW